MVTVIEAREHLETYLETVRSASNGLINDFRPRSIVSVLGRAFSEGLNALEVRLNARINAEILEAVPRLFGFTESTGTKSQIVLVFTPSRINTAKSFEIGAGFRVTINGWAFTTDSLLSVAPNTLNGLVTATALLPGVKGNISGNPTDINWESIEGLLSVTFKSLIIQGTDLQTIDTLSSDITQTLINRSLIKSDNYEYAAKTILGSNSAVKAIANLAKDKISFERGSMHIFGSAGGVALTEDKKRSLYAELAKGWATVYISDIVIVKINVQIYLRAKSGVDQVTLTALITDMLRSRFNSSTYSPGDDVDLYDLIGALYKVEGVDNIGLCQLNKNNGVFEGKDIPLKKYETVQFNTLNIIYVAN
jgi:hypothetical protein